MKNLARLHIVQALYQRQIVQSSLDRLLKDFPSWQKGLARADSKDYFTRILTRIIEDEAGFDKNIARFLPKEWRLERLDKVLIAILRAGLAEKHEPYMVVDYVEIAHMLLDRKTAAMANAILDKISEGDDGGKKQEKSLDEKDNG